MSSEDYNEWFVEDGDVRGTGIHHDGTNHYIYRMLRPNLGDVSYYAVLYGTASIEQVMEATESIADRVCKVYGWDMVDSENILTYN